MDKYLSRSSSNPNLASKRPRDNEVSPDKWQRPKKLAACTKTDSNNQETPTDNRFKGLPVDAADTDPDFFAQASRKKKIKNTPPFLIELVGGWTHQKVRVAVEKHCKDYHMQFRGQKLVKVQCYTAKNHQKLKDGLSGDKVFFHTYTRKDEKLPKAVIKGLPRFIHDNIPAELESLGFPGAIVSELRTLVPYECPPILVQLPGGTDMMKFKKIKYLSNCVVEIERFKPNKKTGTQCFRCQGFGHAARNCNRPPRCVKCAEDHPTWECTKKDKESPARCCNCLEEHPANFVQCKERQKYLNRIEARRETQQKVTVHEAVRGKITAPNSRTQTVRSSTGTKQLVAGAIDTTSHPPMVTAEQLPKSHQPAKPPIPMQQAQTTSHTGNISGKIPQDLETMEMLEILSTIQSIKQEFTKCKSFMEKVILILTHLGHYV